MTSEAYTRSSSIAAAPGPRPYVTSPCLVLLDRLIASAATVAMSSVRIRSRYSPHLVGVLLAQVPEQQSPIGCTVHGQGGRDHQPTEAGAKV